MFFFLFFCLVIDIRTQLNEQLRCLDYRMETQISVVGELQDFFRRRAEVELDYSKNLDKLSKSLFQRHKEQKQKCVARNLLNPNPNKIVNLIPTLIPVPILIVVPIIIPIQWWTSS